MNSFTKSNLLYQMDWILKELNFMVETGPRFGTKSDVSNNPIDILAIEMVNPILEEAIVKVKECREKLYGEETEEDSQRRANFKRDLYFTGADSVFDRDRIQRQQFREDKRIISDN